MINGKIGKSRIACPLKMTSPRLFSLFATRLGAFLFAAVLFAAPHALGDSKAIPTTAVGLENKDFPARDLLFNGQPVDPDAAVDLRKTKSVDLSLLQPTENDVWQNRSYEAISDKDLNYPKPEAVWQWKGKVPLNPEGWFRGQVQAVGSDGQTRMYRLVMGLNVHQALMRAALLRKLGYPVQSPRWYRNVRIQFESKESKESFKADLAVEGGLVDHKRWVLKDDEAKNELLVQDVMLEPSTIVVPTAFYMGNLNSSHIDGKRTMRSLLVPFVLVDVPESVAMYSPEPVQIVSDNLIFTHKYAESFQETGLDDVRWISDRIGKLTRADWDAIVAAGQYPSDIGAIILEKTVARRNSLLKFVGTLNRLPQNLRALPYNLSRSVGSVDKGKVTQERYDGYALRFTQGDPQSPLRTDDIVRFFKIEATTAAIKQLTTRVNSELEVLKMDRLLQDRAKGLQQKFFEWANSKPTKPFVQPISTWGGFTAGGSINASRSIVTGSYYGNQSSDFSVNLVDQVSASARVGYFLGVDGLPKVAPGFGANLTVVRSYVHARPVPSIEAADKKAWSELWVPGFMRNIGGLLSVSSAEKPEDRLKEQTASLDKFLEDLKENESFSVTDSLIVAENAAVNIPIMNLLGLAPVSYSNTIVLGAQANQIMLRRTTFTRENGLIKIYLSNVQSQMAGISLDVNFWMNLIRLSGQKKWGQAKTRAFHLEEKPAEEKKQRDVILAVKGILHSNSSEILEANFYPYQLDHRTEAEINDGKFLFWRWTSIEEWHRVKVKPPKDPDNGIDPDKWQRTLFSHRILNRSGKNYYSFLSDVLDGLVQKSNFWRGGILSSNTGSNPKDSFFGSAKWSVTTTEAEITKGKESNPVTTLENYWSGWDLSKTDLFKVIDGLDQRVQNLRLGIGLIDRNVFNDMRRLQLYEIRSTLIVYEEAMTKIRKTLLMKNDETGKWYEFGWDKMSGTDDDLVAKVLIPLYGKDRFASDCLTQNQPQGEAYGSEPRKQFEHGQGYTCILPWMTEILNLRREYPRNREERIKWSTRVMTLLEHNVDLGKLVRFLGPKNVFYQVKISGFRTRDENGDTADYKSSTVGTFNTKDRAGVFKDFVSDYQIMSSEMNASYLSEGY